MITLSVISFNDQPADGALSVTFDELGGSIGRADINQLVLPDPDRMISRIHAQVVFRNGAYAIVDRGSNPVSVNDRPLGNGREAPIREGDIVTIGGYRLQVKAAAGGSAGKSADPFADLLGPASSPAPAARPGAPGAAADPFAAFGFGAPPAPPAPQAVRAPSPPPSSASAPTAGGIPDDWDPFAPDPVPAGSKDSSRALGLGGGSQLGLEVGAAAAGPLIPDMAPSASDNSLDNLFGLKPGVGDPLGNSVLNDAAAKPNMAANADPLRSLGSAPQATGATSADNLSDLQRPFIPPAAPPRPVAPMSPPPQAPAQQLPDDLFGLAPVRAPSSPGSAAPAAREGKSSLPPAAVLSWQDPESDGHTVIRPSSRQATPEPPAPAFTPAMPPIASPASPRPAAPPPVVAAPVAPAPAPAPASAPRPPASPANQDALLAAFREGLGHPTVEVGPLTPELMRLLGQLIGEAASGTVDLLVARAAMKREIRAEATMIVARENNPLKFSPSAEAALNHLLSPPTRGFMAAAPAMRDAYDDLRAHQYAFVAGMRAALEGVLGRFEPSELEGRLTQKSMLSSLLPGSRKARMWEVFVEMYTQIRSEASDDFHTLFGKAFLKAYEEHIDQLQGDRK